MPPPSEAAELERFVQAAAHALGLEIRPEWRPAVAEHYRRLLEAAEVIERSPLPTTEPATKFEP
jgi:hypothetical protein